MTAEELLEMIRLQRRAYYRAAPNDFDTMMVAAMDATRSPPLPAGLRMTEEARADLIRSTPAENISLFWPPGGGPVTVYMTFAGLPIFLDPEATEVTILGDAEVSAIKVDLARREISMEELRKSALASRGVRF